MGVNCSLDKLETTLLKLKCWNKKNKNDSAPYFTNHNDQIWPFHFCFVNLFPLSVDIAFPSYCCGASDIYPCKHLNDLLVTACVISPFPLMLVDAEQNRNLIMWFHNCYCKDLHQDSLRIITIKRRQHSYLAHFSIIFCLYENVCIRCNS